MKKGLRITVVLFINLILITSCHKEEPSSLPKDKNNAIKIKRSSFNNFEKLPMLIEQLLPSNENLNIASKDSDNLLYDFEIDSTTITHISRNGTSFYTMAIFRNTNKTGIFENLVLSDDGLTQKAYLIKYFPNAIYYNKVKNDIHTPFVGGINFQEININELSNRLATVRICIRYTQVFCNYGGEEHPAGANCTAAFIYTESFQNCFTVYVTVDEPEYMVDLNIGQESGSGNGGGGATAPPEILTEPLFLFNIRPFENSLTQAQKVVWNLLSNDIKQKISKFLEKNETEEGEEYAKQLLNYLHQMNSSPEAVEEINNILNLLDDGKLNGEDVLVGPDVTIPNMTQYLSIFNASQPAEITIYADQPVAGSHFPISYSERAGHAIITIKQGTKIRSLGFYPQSTPASLVLNNLTLDPADFISVPSSFGNDENHDFDVSLSMPVTAGQLLNTINNIKTLFQSNVPYNLKTSNCADFAITIFNSINIPIIPSCETPKSYWSGQTPATLGEVIRTMPLQPGTNRNIIGGNIPPNSTN